MNMVVPSTQLQSRDVVIGAAMRPVLQLLVLGGAD